MRRLTLIIALLTLALLATTLPAAARDQMALGVSMPNQDLVGFTGQMTHRGGEPPALWSIWSQWGARGANKQWKNKNRECNFDLNLNCAFPAGQATQAWNAGATPVIWWEPVIPGASFQANERFGRHKRTLQGKNDKYIRQWANRARAWGEAEDRKIILRLAHEGNGTFFPWTIGNYDNTNKTFKKFWRHVWKIFKQQGARPYVDFFWSMNKKKCKGCNPFKVIWPGGKYIDYVGFTAFNWGKQKSWKSMMKVLEQPMRQLGKVTKEPVIVGELASHFKPTSKSKADWIRNGYNGAYSKWPRLKGIMYLNAKPGFGHPDWRLDKPDDGSALQAYADITSLFKFKGVLD